jgi:hypothetical protein
VQSSVCWNIVLALEPTLLTLPEFAQELQGTLADLKDLKDTSHLTDELKKQIQILKSSTLRKPQRHEQLDTVATVLWNTCIRLKREDDNDTSSSTRKVLIYTRVFAFLMLSLAQWTERNTPYEMIRLAKIALKASRSCIGKSQTCHAADTRI